MYSVYICVYSVYIVCVREGAEGLAVGRINISHSAHAQQGSSSSSGRHCLIRKVGVCTMCGVLLSVDHRRWSLLRTQVGGHGGRATVACVRTCSWCSALTLTLTLALTRTHTGTHSHWHTLTGTGRCVGRRGARTDSSVNGRPTCPHPCSAGSTTERHIACTVCVCVCECVCV